MSTEQRVVRDTVGDVAQKELAAAGHADVPHHEQVSAGLLGSADNGHGRIGVHDHPRVSPRACQPGHQLSQLLGLLTRPHGVSLPGLGPRRLTGQQDPDDVKLSAVPVGHLRSQIQRGAGGQRAFGANHDVLDLFHFPPPVRKEHGCTPPSLAPPRVARPAYPSRTCRRSGIPTCRGLTLTLFGSGAHLVMDPRHISDETT